MHALDRPDLKDAAVDAGHPARARRPSTTSHVDIFAVLREGDVLVHHPYDSFSTSVEEFIQPGGRRPQGAGHQADPLPHVGRQPDRARRSSGPPSGASRWPRWSSSRPASTSRPTSSGPARWRRRACTSSTAWSGLKTHTKTALVVRDEPDGIRRYCHIGTGNYNPKTARLYEDLGLLTADPDLGADLTQLFNYLTGYGREHAVPQAARRPARAAARASPS